MRKAIQFDTMTSHVTALSLEHGRVAAMNPSEDTLSLLRRWPEPGARGQLFDIIYPELRRIAAANLRRERPGHMLQPTALVNEAFIRLVRLNAIDWQDRVHFLSVAAGAMKRVLLDHARSRNSLRRGSGVCAVSQDEVAHIDPFDQLIEIDILLSKLAARNPRVVETFELHYFGGLTFDQVGAALSVDPRTAKRDWQLAQRWLREALEPGEAE